MTHVPVKLKATLGRPTKLTDKVVQDIVDGMATGLSAEAAAAQAGVSATTLYIWQNKYPEFVEAIQMGRQLALLWWEQRARDMAQGASGSAQIVSLGLRNRSRSASGWIASERLEISGPNGGPVQKETTHKFDLNYLTDEELEVLDRAFSKISDATGERIGFDDFE